MVLEMPRPFARERLPDLLLQGLAVIAVEARVGDADEGHRSRTRGNRIQARGRAAAGKPHGSGADGENAPS